MKSDLERLVAIDPYHARNDSIKSPEQLQKLQTALMEYENRNISMEITLIEKALENASNTNDIQTAREKTKKISEDILRWSAAFRGN